MALTDSIAGVTAQASSAAKQRGAASLGIEEFLQLMTAQLKNQDPLKPLDGTQFVAQLAQFGTVSGIQAMRDSLGTLAESLRASQALSGASLVGHSVLAPAEHARYDGQQALSGAVDVPQGARAVTVRVLDAAGQTVRHLALNAQAGIQNYHWDGLADSGALASAGRYKFEATADVAGEHAALKAYMAGRVNSVSIDPEGTGLSLNTSELGTLALGSVFQVR